MMSGIEEQIILKCPKGCSREENDIIVSSNEQVLGWIVMETDQQKLDIDVVLDDSFSHDHIPNGLSCDCTHDFEGRLLEMGLSVFNKAIEEGNYITWDVWFTIYESYEDI